MIDIILLISDLIRNQNLLGELLWAFLIVFAITSFLFKEPSFCAKQLRKPLILFIIIITLIKMSY